MDNQKQSKKIQTPKFIYIVKLLIIFIPVVASSILALSFAYTTYKSPADKSSAETAKERAGRHAGRVGGYQNQDGS